MPKAFAGPVIRLRTGKHGDLRAKCGSIAPALPPDGRAFLGLMGALGAALGHRAVELRAASYVRIPAGAQSGRQMRVRGKGLPSNPPGDLYLDIRIVTPPADTPKAKEHYETMAKAFDFDPRAQ